MAETHIDLLIAFRNPAKGFTVLLMLVKYSVTLCRVAELRVSRSRQRQRQLVVNPAIR